MRSKESTSFRFADRNKNHTLLLIPGWATDYRIFENLNLQFNYLLPIHFHPESFEESLLEILRRYNIKKISIFGFSLGGFIAARFAENHNRIVSELLLVGVRERYGNEEIESVRLRLERNKKAFLYKFYRDCFPEWESVPLPIKNLLKNYCEEMELDFLIGTLNYLKKAKLDFENLKNIENLTIVHGSRDKIAPAYFRDPVAEKNSNVRLVHLEGAGHMPFLEKGIDVAKWFTKN